MVSKERLVLIELNLIEYWPFMNFPTSVSDEPIKRCNELLEIQF